MLEPVDKEALQWYAVEHFIVVHLDRTDCVQAFYLWEEDERIQIIVCEDQLFEFREFLQFVKICVIHDEIEPDIVEVDFFNEVIELSTLENFKSIPIDVEDFVWFDFCVATLDKRLVWSI